MSAVAETSRSDTAYAALASADPALARVVDRVGRPDPFSWGALDELAQGDPFRELVLHITGQQISVAAALSIFGRVRDTAGGAVTPEAISALSVEELRAAGLSRAKAMSLHDLSARILDGRLSFERLAASTDEDAIAELDAVRGIGPWSAQMFALHHLRREDVFPTGDVGLLRAAHAVFGLPERPTPAELDARALAWRPFRSYAAALLWASGGPS